MICWIRKKVGKDYSPLGGCNGEISHSSPLMKYLKKEFADRSSWDTGLVFLGAKLKAFRRPVHPDGWLQEEAQGRNRYRDTIKVCQKLRSLWVISRGFGYRATQLGSFNWQSRTEDQIENDYTVFHLWKQREGRMVKDRREGRREKGWTELKLACREKAGLARAVGGSKEWEVKTAPSDWKVQFRRAVLVL